MALIQCPTCGNMEDIQSTACSECGAPIAASKKCEECGCPLDSDSTLCPECGNPVENASNAAVVPAADNTSGVPVPIQQNIYSPPPAAAAVSTEDLAAAKKRKRFMVYNIIGLLLMIFPTVLFMGKMFVFESNIIVSKSFEASFNEFSDVVTELKNIVSNLKFTNSDLVETIYDRLNFFSSFKYVFYAILLYSAYHFVSGWFKVGKGKLLSYSFHSPLIYYAIGFITVKVLGQYVTNPVNEVSSLFGQTITCNLTSDFGIIAIIAVASFLFYAIITLIEGNSVQGRAKTKK